MQNQISCVTSNRHMTSTFIKCTHKIAADMSDIIKNRLVGQASDSMTALT